MNKNPFFIWASLFALISFTLFACKKEKLEEVLTNISALKAQAQSEQMLAAVMDVVQEHVSQIQALNTGLPPLLNNDCPKISTSGNSFPMTITLDFGNGCTTDKGQQMAGIITILASGKTETTGTTLDVSIKDFKANGNFANGNIQLVTAGASGQAQQDLKIVVSTLKVLSAEGKTIYLEDLRGTRTQTEGKSTVPKLNGKAALMDDVFEIAFEGKGIDSEDKAFTLKTLKPLVRRYDCKYIVSGVIEYNAGVPIKTADYGNGTCDQILVISAGGATKTVNLP